MQLPKIGDNIEKFIDSFGTPTKESSDILYLFDVEGIGPRLSCSVLEEKVYNISWSLPFDIHQVTEIAQRFLPQDAQLVREAIFEVKPLMNGDVPIKEDLYRLRNTEQDLFFGLGEDSNFTIHLEINK